MAAVTMNYLGPGTRSIDISTPEIHPWINVVVLNQNLSIIAIVGIVRAVIKVNAPKPVG